MRAACQNCRLGAPPIRYIECWDKPLLWQGEKRILGHRNMNWTAVFYALFSAALFGVSTPAAKVLLESIHPGVLAGLLYCAAGVGITLLRWVRPVVLGTSSARDTVLTRAELPWLAGAIAAGGMIAPVLLMTGVSLTDASAASLLLTLESAATALMAWFIFHENFDRRIALGLLCLVGGAVALAWSGVPTLARVIGPIAIVGACIMWGLDNNLTRKVSLADPLQIVQFKGLIAGPINVALGLWIGASLPGALDALLAGVVGFLGYGVSLALSSSRYGILVRRVPGLISRPLRLWVRWLPLLL